MTQEHTLTTRNVREYYVERRRNLAIAAGGLPVRISEAYAEFDRWLDAEIRAAKAEAWEEGLSLAVRTLEAHKNGDQFGGLADLSGMAGYIETAINPYRANKEAGS